MEPTEHQPLQQFVRPQYNYAGKNTDARTLNTLPELVEHNAVHNGGHLFCLQYTHNTDGPPRRVTYKELHLAVLRCSVWLASLGLSQPPRLDESGTVVKARPIGLLMTSDLAWFIHFLALLRLGIPVLCMSARLSARAVVHLLHETDTQTLLSSRQLQSLVDEALELAQPNDSDGPNVPPAVFHVLSYDEFLNTHSSLQVHNAPPLSRSFGGSDRNVVIMHSSGTTGLPKPIFHSHAYLLGYAACHRLSAADVSGAVNVSTLPLYHGFGLLAPCLALSVGMPIALLAATTIPTGASVSTVLRSAGATSLMTVPSILEELFLLNSDTGLQGLKALRFVAVGGAPMKHSVAKPLAEAGVALLNHWGVTEIGAIAPIVVPSPDHNWRFLRLRDDIGLRVERVDGDHGGKDGHYRLVGCAPGSEEEFVVQDLLAVNPEKPSEEFRIAGRADDLIVLATGEKVRPTVLESAVSEHPLVKAALAFGDKQFQLGLIIEAAPHVELDLSQEQSVEAYIGQIWSAIEYANQVMDAHAEVTRDMIVVTTPSARPLVRTPKGSVPRQPNVQQFRDEIEAKYNGRSDRVDQSESDVPQIDIHDQSQVAEAIRQELRVCVGRMAQNIGDDDDFFERGMNSLQATVLRKRLNQLFRKPLSVHGAVLPQNFVYENPSALRVAGALVAICDGTTQETPKPDRAATMQRLVEEYTEKLHQIPQQHTSDSASGHSGDHKVRIILTGSTGSLGSSLVGELVKRSEVETVYALNRQGPCSLRSRQEKGLRNLGIELGPGWQKVVLLDADLAAEQFGLDNSSYEELRTATHMIHNAWPMDFKRNVDSFRPHFDATLNIVKLACAARHPVRILFSSSIAAVGQYPQAVESTDTIKEKPNQNTAVVERFGYAEAKWVCEQLFEAANKACPKRLAATSVRIGQIAGSEATGAWSTVEHFPRLVKSCQAVGKVPDIPGHASWIPVNTAAAAMTDILFAPVGDGGAFPPVVHLENPRRQPWLGITQALGAALGLPQEARVDFTEWLRLVKAFQARPGDHGDDHEGGDTATDANPASKLIPFLEDSFIRLATGDVILDTTIAQSMSGTLRECGVVSDELLGRYVEHWRADGFIR